MYRVFPVEGGYQIFWCPSAPHHYNDKVAYIDPKNVSKNGIYSRRQAAYRRVAELNIVQGMREERASQDEAYALPCTQCGKSEAVGTNPRGWNGWHKTVDHGWQLTMDIHNPMKYPKFCEECREKM